MILVKYPKIVFYFIFNAVQILERVAGIEPASSAWKADVLPLYDTRVDKEPRTMNTKKDTHKRPI